MRNDDVDGTGAKPGAKAPARIELHPAASTAADGMISAMAAEFDRWMADEVEELAEGYAAAEGQACPERLRLHLRDLAAHLARQADMLGYPHIVETATRLASRFEPKACGTADDLSDAGPQIAKLRALLTK